jgi:hypothetical protein
MPALASDSDSDEDIAAVSCPSSAAVRQSYHRSQQERDSVVLARNANTCALRDARIDLSDDHASELRATNASAHALARSNLSSEDRTSELLAANASAHALYRSQLSEERSSALNSINAVAHIANLSRFPHSQVRSCCSG